MESILQAFSRIGLLKRWAIAPSIIYHPFSSYSLFPLINMYIVIVLSAIASSIKRIVYSNEWRRHYRIWNSIWKVLLYRYLLVNVQLICGYHITVVYLLSSQWMTTNHIVLVNYLYPYLVTFVKGGERMITLSQGIGLTLNQK